MGLAPGDAPLAGVPWLPVVSSMIEVALKCKYTDLQVKLGVMNRLRPIDEPDRVGNDTKRSNHW